MKKLNYLLFATWFWASTIAAQGLNFPGGRGLQHLHTAWTLSKGAVTLHASTTSFYKTVLVKSQTQGTQSITFWDVQGALGLYVATSDHMELGLNQLVYQDTHQGGNGYEAPSDLSLRVKLGNYGKIQSRFRMGLLIEGRIPLGKAYNIPLEPYNSGRFEFGITGLLSYSTDLLIPEAGVNFHLNLGFWNHNDVGKFLTGAANDRISALDLTRSWVWGVGMIIPASQFDFGLEFFGRSFFVRPPVTAYSREDYIYMTPSVFLRISNRIAMSAGLDIRLTQDYDKTRYQQDGTTLPRIHPEMPSYPGWRLRVGTRIYLNKSEPKGIDRPLFTSKGREVKMDSEEAANKLTLQEQLVRERRETEIAEEELRKIREDRKKMEEMLARLRQILQYGKTLEPQKVTEKEPTEEKEKVTKKNN
ncbi:MAG: hypothetical protein Q9P90_14950 [candidate division KSB1 bacterium]|nr:hypothetical protein [candidate division KSB1 bacterium]